MLLCSTGLHQRFDHHSCSRTSTDITICRATLWLCIAMLSFVGTNTMSTPIGREAFTPVQASQARGKSALIPHKVPRLTFCCSPGSLIAGTWAAMHYMGHAYAFPLHVTLRHAHRLAEVTSSHVARSSVRHASSHTVSRPRFRSCTSSETLRQRSSRSEAPAKV